jgi:hypothetical protein
LVSHDVAFMDWLVESLSAFMDVIEVLPSGQLALDDG